MHKKLWNRDFVLIIQGNAVSAIGDLLYSVAIGYWVYEATGSSTLMGVMSSVSMFVTMLLSPFSGSIVDKYNRKWVIVGMDVLRGIIMLIIGALAYANALNVPGVLAAAFLAAVCSVFFTPAVSTLLIDIIPHNDMIRGQSIHSSVVGLIQMVGKALSGVLVAFLGVPLIIAVNGICYLLSAVTELFIKVPKTIQQGETVTVMGVLRDFKTALGQIYSIRALGLFVTCELLLNLLSSAPAGLMLPFMMDKGFTVDMYGYLLSVQTAAGLLSVFLMGVVKFNPKTRYWLMGICYNLSLLLYIFAFITKNYLFMCVMVFIGCFMTCVGNAIFKAAMMLALPLKNRGAILGFINAASTGGVALATVIAGALGDIMPLYLVFVAGNVLSFVPMLYLCLSKDTKNFIMTH